MGDSAGLKNHFPFHTVGLQCNPFRALTDEEWAEIAVLPAELLVAVKTTSSHIQLLGEKGRGKTTSLLGLHKWFSQGGQASAYEYLPEGENSFETDPADIDIFLLDETQRLSRRERNRLLSSAPRLVFSSHEDLTTLFQQNRLSLISFHLDTISAPQLKQILNQRVAYFALDTATPPTFSPTAVHFLQTHFKSNLRASQFFLYEVFQHWAKMGHIPQSISEAHLTEYSDLVRPRTSF